MSEQLAARLLDALPQTQCTRCGYPDCAGYAQAIAAGSAGINQCPPGGQEGVRRLAAITGAPELALDPQFGTEAPRLVAWIDEAWCIGCTLCLKACPTDAIIGMNKRMHTVIEPLCTGCELCVPACPVDCIHMDEASGAATGWQAWSTQHAQQARQRYAQRTIRLARADQVHAQTKAQEAQAVLDDLPAHSRIQDPEALARKQRIVQAAVERSRTKGRAAG